MDDFIYIHAYEMIVTTHVQRKCTLHSQQHVNDSLYCQLLIICMFSFIHYI